MYSFPAASTGLQMLNAATMFASASQRLASAKSWPAHILFGQINSRPIGHGHQRVNVRGGSPASESKDETAWELFVYHEPSFAEMTLRNELFGMWELVRAAGHSPR